MSYSLVPVHTVIIVTTNSMEQKIINRQKNFTTSDQELSPNLNHVRLPFVQFLLTQSFHRVLHTSVTLGLCVCLSSCQIYSDSMRSMFKASLTLFALFRQFCSILISILPRSSSWPFSNSVICPFLIFTLTSRHNTPRRNNTCKWKY